MPELYTVVSAHRMVSEPHHGIPSHPRTWRIGGPVFFRFHESSAVEHVTTHCCLYLRSVAEPTTPLLCCVWCAVGDETPELAPFVPGVQVSGSPSADGKVMQFSA